MTQKSKQEITCYFQGQQLRATVFGIKKNATEAKGIALYINLGHAIILNCRNY
jgi:hypothetical protein